MAAILLKLSGIMVLQQWQRKRVNYQTLVLWENFDDEFDCDEDTVAMESISHILGNSIDDIDSDNFYLP